VDVCASGLLLGWFRRNLSRENALRRVALLERAGLAISARLGYRGSTRPG
jgi:hypothetical protein